MTEKLGIPVIDGTFPYQYAPPDLSPAIPLATQRLAANCFVATTGTPFSAVGNANLNQLSRFLQQEKDKGNDSVAVGIWSTAVDQARAVMATDSVNQRLERSAVFAYDVVAHVLPRQAVTAMLRHDHDGEPPLRAASAPPSPLPGRCR